MSHVDIFDIMTLRGWSAIQKWHLYMP